MTPAAKVTYVAAVVIGLAAGFFVGFRTGTVASDALYDAQRMAAVMEVTSFSNMQYRHADPQHAKEALLTCAKFLEQMENVKPDSTQEVDLAIAYTRLALLEDAAQNAEQSQAYMHKARSWHKASGGRDASDVDMKTGQRKIDEVMQR